MSPRVNHPDSLATMFEDIHRRLRALETAPAASYTSVDVGTFQVKDNNGNVTARLGLLGNGSYGVEVISQAIGEVILVDTAGFGLPFFAAPFRSANTAEQVTSASPVPVWRTEIELLQYDAVRVRIPWATAAATTGQLKFVCTTGPTQTAVVNLPAGSSGTQDFHWLHAQTLGAGPIYFEVQAARTGGTGSVAIYAPDGGATFYRGSLMNPPATASGL